MKKYILIILLLVGSKSFAQTVYNGGFESWNNLLIFMEPQGYVSSNYASLLLGSGGLPRANVFRSTTKQAGTYAAKLESYAQNVGDTTGVPGIMVTGELDLNNVSIKPGFAISGGRPTALKGYYKYAEGNMPDSGIISVALTKYDSTAGFINVIAGGIGVFSNKGEYTEFNIPIDYATNDEPDTAIIVISTTSVFSFDTTALTSAPVGSVLYVDELSFVTSGGVGIQKIEDLIEASLYPNPSSNRIYVDYVQEHASEVNIQLLSIDGRVVYEETKYHKAGKQKITIDVANIDAGMYQFVATTAEGRISKAVAVVR